MKNWLKIVLIVIGIMILALIVFGIFTYYQVKELMGYVQDKSIEADLKAVMNGDCTKVPGLEVKMQEIEASLKSACKNPVLKKVIEKSEYGDLCSNSEMIAQMKNGMEILKSACAAQNAQAG